MFDLSAVNGEITDAVLQFTVDSDEGDGIIEIHRGQESTWTENTITSANAPQIGDPLGSVASHFKMKDTQKVPLDKTKVFPELTSLVLSHKGENDLAIASKEHQGKIGPKLIVTYNAVPGTPIPDTGEDESETETDPIPEEPVPSFEKGFYVTTTGKADNDGLTEATAWNIEHAFETAVAGNIVYIKAGDYGNKQLVVDNSGTEGNPIKFIGYTNTPEDINTNKQGSTFKYGDVLNPTQMPVLTGVVTNGIGIGNGIIANENHVEIANIQITKYSNGLISSGDFCNR